jgi:hypothetical protein
VFHAARSPAFPVPVPAKKPTVGVNVYSKPVTAKLVDAGAAEVAAGIASVTADTSATASN